jgi:hypothetical protein
VSKTIKIEIMKKDIKNEIKKVRILLFEIRNKIIKEYKIK